MKVSLQDKQNKQLYYHFNDLEKSSQLDKLNNYKITEGTTEIKVRWFDHTLTKKYKNGMTLKTILKKALSQIKKIIKDQDLSLKSLNASGLTSIEKKKNKIFIEPQFS